MDVKSKYIGMLAATAERVHGSRPAVKQASIWGPLLTAVGIGAGGRAIGAMTTAGGKAIEYGVPSIIMTYFTKYIGIPAGIGYILGNSLAKSTSPSKNDLLAAENNALAKETMNRAKELEKIPGVKPQDKAPKDMSWIGGM